MAAANARRLNADVTLVACDLAACFAAGSIDVLVSNPRYVPQEDLVGLLRAVRDYEPHVALFGGPTGVEMYKRLIEQARSIVRPGGWLLFELGYNSVGPVREMLGRDWVEVEVRSDLAGLPRVLEARQYEPNHSLGCLERIAG